MSKELSPLEAFNKITSGGCKGKYHEYCEIVETALKNYEELTNTPPILCRRTQGGTQSIIDYICKNYKEVKITNLEDEKKLKALEIIKEKRVNIFTFYECCSWHNPSNYNDSLGCPVNCELTQEEYDLLKEVLR